MMRFEYSESGGKVSLKIEYENSNKDHTSKVVDFVSVATDTVVDSGDLQVPQSTPRFGPPPAHLVDYMERKSLESRVLVDEDPVPEVPDALKNLIGDTSVPEVDTTEVSEDGNEREKFDPAKLESWSELGTPEKELFRDGNNPNKPTGMKDCPVCRGEEEACQCQRD